jgi:valyl-tRNA synthetase
MGDLPFKDVYFTSILRDETGRKLSKSLGNSPNPLDLFDEFGTDAVRFGIMLMAPQGLDVMFSKDRLDIGRNFMNKLWNACRFVQMNIPENWDNEIDLDSADLDLSEQWILSRLSKTVDDYNRQLDRFHFNEAAKVLYEFTWSDFCDWYVEIAKTRFYGDDETKAEIARTVALKCIRTILTLLHPYSPFITEELWSHFKKVDALDLIVAPWAKSESSQNETAESDMSLLKDIITSIRSIKSRMNVPPSKFSDLVVRCDTNQQSFLETQLDLIKQLARVGELSMGTSLEKPGQSATAVVGGMELYIPLGGLVDLDEEKVRMEKRIKEINRLISGINGKLSNENFMNRAPEQVVAKEKSNLEKLTEEFEKVTANLEMLQ